MAEKWEIAETDLVDWDARHVRSQKSGSSVFLAGISIFLLLIVLASVMLYNTL